MAKSNSLILIGVFIITFSLSPICANAEIKGDANGNGILGLEDAIFILQVLSGIRDNKSYIGSWGSGYDPYGDPNVEWASFTFYPNGYYIYWESRNGSEVEYGTYSYNPVTENMTFNPTHDDNVNEGPNGTHGNVDKIVVNGDTMTVGEGGEAFSLERVKAQ